MCMPFGIASAPGPLFKKTMESVLQGIKQVVCNIDDILVTGSMESEVSVFSVQPMEATSSYCSSLKAGNMHVSTQY